jgi:hypothetical protein
VVQFEIYRTGNQTRPGMKLSGMERRPNFQRITISQAKAEVAKAREVREAIMPKRALMIVRVTFPLTAICGSCEKRFMSRSEDWDSARNEIEAAFDAHKCKKQDASQAAAPIVREATEDR